MAYRRERPRLGAAESGPRRRHWTTWAIERVDLDRLARTWLARVYEELGKMDGLQQDEVARRMAARAEMRRWGSHLPDVSNPLAVANMTRADLYEAGRENVAEEADAWVEQHGRR
jgi:hypothetical protein